MHLKLWGDEELNLLLALALSLQPHELVSNEFFLFIEKASPNSKSPKNSPNGKISSKQSPKAQGQSPRQRKAKAGSHD